MTVETPNTPVVTGGARYNQAVDQGGVDSFKQFEAKMAAEEMGQKTPDPEPKVEVVPAPKEVDQDLGDDAAEETASEGENATHEDVGTDAERDGEPKPKEAAKEGDKSAEGDKKKNRVPAKNRIAELTKARGEAERRAEAEAAENKRLREENEALKAGKKPSTIAAEAGDEEPDPEKYTYGTLDPDYLKDVRAYGKAQARKEAEAERQREAAERTASERRTAHEAQVEALDAEVGDFVEVVVQGAMEGKWACTPLMNEFILDSDNGAKIAYHFAKNPAEADKVAAMSERDAAKWFGRKEVELAAPSSQGKQPAKAAVSKADPPFEPARGNNGKFKAKGDTTDYAAFERDHKHLLEHPSF